MSDEKYTRCPNCATVFRVAPEQLSVRAGQVRCGQCKTVFDGIAEQVAVTPPIRPDVATWVDAPAPAPPQRTVGQAPAPDPPAAAPMDDAQPAAPPQPEVAEAPPEDRFARPSKWSRRARIASYAAATVVLVVLVAAQATYHFRDSIVTYWPVARPSFERLCALAGCAIRPLRDSAMSHLSIEASDLQADPAHRGLLILTATLRNRAAWPLAYPHLELTLSDAQDRVVVRRALAPADYAGGTADLQKGIAANGEVALKLFIDASATSQAGYRLYMFYP